MADPLLSELCGICHINPHKYRCPRCSTRTCSLPCIKRHKKWAQCSGIRDPAAYLKRDELATPSGIDRDYNFLTSIERKIDNAERDAGDRGVVLRGVDARSWREKGFNGPMKGEMQMQAAIERSKVVVDRAPKGMARAKQNKSRWQKKVHCLRWTVEWIHNDGGRDLGEFLETRPISEAYEQQFGNAEPPKKKRQVLASKEDSATTADISTQFMGDLKQLAPSESSARVLVSKSRLRKPLAPSESSDPPPPAMAVPDPDQSFTDAPTPSAPSMACLRPLNFYLYLPSTPTSARVLIPLSLSSTLSTALPHRLVLEFPTIYALRQPPDELPEGFTTEEQYLKGLRKGEVKGNLNESIEEVEDGEFGKENLDEGSKPMMNEKRLVDVLRKDLGGGLV